MTCFVSMLNTLNYLTEGRYVTIFCGSMTASEDLAPWKSNCVRLSSSPESVFQIAKTPLAQSVLKDWFWSPFSAIAMILALWTSVTPTPLFNKRADLRLFV